MDKKIKNLLLVLKCVFFSIWLLSILLYVIGKMGWLADMCLEPQSTSEYIVECICVALVVFGCPLSMKLFTLNTTKNLMRMNFDDALKSYSAWSVIRLAILGLGAIFGVLAYFMTLKMSCGICTLIALTFTLLCYPKEEKIRLYLDNLNNEEN